MGNRKTVLAPVLAVVMTFAAVLAPVAASSGDAGAIQPWRLVESPSEARLGQGVHEHYLSLGMRLVPNPRAEAVWARLEPVFKRSFTRTPFGLYVFERTDADIMSAPGHLYISTGAIEKLTDGELATVISHEFVHMMDSTMLKSLQHAMDSGFDRVPVIDGTAAFADLLRGHSIWEEGMEPTLEGTALYFGSALAKEAGYRPSDLVGAWKRLAKDPTVEFEDYVRLHGLYPQMWPYLESQLAEFEPTAGGPEPPGAEGGDPRETEKWVIRTLDLTIPVMGPATAHSKDQGPLTRDPVDFTVAAGLLSHQPLGDQSWRVVPLNGGEGHTLDSRDNLFIQYTDLGLGDNGNLATVTTQQDVLLYDLREGTSQWMGIGRESALSPGSNRLAYTDGYSVYLKDTGTGRLIHRFDADPKGIISGLAWEPSGRRLAALDSGDRSTLLFFDTETGTTRVERLSDPAMAQPAWLPGGLLIVTGGKAPGIRFIPNGNGGGTVHPLDLPQGSAILSVQAIEGPRGPMMAMVLGEYGDTGLDTRLVIAVLSGDRLEVHPIGLDGDAVGIAAAYWNGPGQLVASILTK